MELRHLNYFKVLASELHFRKAAEKLHIVQPALSRQIKELEQDLGVLLFERNRRKVTLTPAGQYLQEQTNLIFHQFEELKTSLKKIAAMEIGLVRIGYVASAIYSVLPDFLTKIKTKFPDIQCSLEEITTEMQIQQVLNGVLEFGFVRCPIFDDKVACKNILKERFALIMPAEHPFLKQGKKDFSTLKSEPFVFFQRRHNAGFYDKTISVCYKLGFAPKIQFEGFGSNTLIQLVASGLGITILPLSIAQVPNPRIGFIELDHIDEFAELAVIYDEKRIPPVLMELL